MTIDKYKIAEYLKSYAIVYNYVIRNINTSFFDAYMKGVDIGYIKLKKEEFYDMVHIVALYLQIRKYSYMKDFYISSFNGKESNENYFEHIFINKDDSKNFTNKDIITNIRNAFCHNNNIYEIVYDENGYNIIINMNDGKSSKVKGRIPFEVKVSYKDLIDLEGLLITKSSLYNECSFISETESKELLKNIRSLKFINNIYKPLNASEINYLNSIKMDSKYKLLEIREKLKKRFTSKEDTKNSKRYSYEQQNTIYNNCLDWKNRTGFIEPYEVIGYEGIKALPSGYLKKEPMDVLLFIVTQMKYDLPLLKNISEYLKDLMTNREDSPFKISFFNINENDEINKRVYTYHLLDVQYQSDLLLSLYFGHMLDSVIDDDKIVINGKEYDKRRLRNSFVHGRWYINSKGKYELFDCDRKIRNEFDFDFHRSIRTNDLIDAFEPYLESHRADMQL